MSLIRKIVATGAAITILFSCVGLAGAVERPYHEGYITDVFLVRTEPGKKAEYMKYLGGQWMDEMDALKKSGAIFEYEVLFTQPTGPDDADVIVCIAFKNWAQYDTVPSKYPALEKRLYGQPDFSTDISVDLNKLRRLVGTQRVQYIELK